MSTVLEKAMSLNLPPELVRDLKEGIVYDVPVSEVFADSDFNVRGEIAPNSIIELSRDIKSKGLLQPITLQPWLRAEHPGIKYRIIAGHRRFMAHQIAEMTHVRSLFKLNLSDLDAMMWNLVENLHREELNKFQEAQSIKRMKMLGMTEVETATKVGKSRGWVQVRYMILSLPHAVQEEVAAGTLTDQQIRECYTLSTHDEQIDFVKRVKDAKLLGKTRAVKPQNAKSGEKKLRSITELEEIQDTVRETMGNNLATVCLGWAMGLTSNWAMHQAIKKAATDAGTYYQIPSAYMTKPADED